MCMVLHVWYLPLSCARCCTCGIYRFHVHGVALVVSTALMCTVLHLWYLPLSCARCCTFGIYRSHVHGVALLVSTALMCMVLYVVSISCSIIKGVMSTGVFISSTSLICSHLYCIYSENYTPASPGPPPQKNKHYISPSQDTLTLTLKGTVA